jgi:hypothetical protein
MSLFFHFLFKWMPVFFYFCTFPCISHFILFFNSTSVLLHF